MTFKEMQKELGKRGETNTYVAATVAAVKDGYYQLGIAASDYDKAYCRSVIAKNLKLLEEIL